MRIEDLLEVLEDLIRRHQYHSEFNDMAIEVKYIKQFIEENK